MKKKQITKIIVSIGMLAAGVAIIALPLSEKSSEVLRGPLAFFYPTLSFLVGLIALKCAFEAGFKAGEGRPTHIGNISPTVPVERVKEPGLLMRFAGESPWRLEILKHSGSSAYVLVLVPDDMLIPEEGEFVIAETEKGLVAAIPFLPTSPVNAASC